MSCWEGRKQNQESREDVGMAAAVTSHKFTNLNALQFSPLLNGDYNIPPLDLSLAMVTYVVGHDRCQ